jgi:hypothetical protein
VAWGDGCFHTCGFAILGCNDCTNICAWVHTVLICLSEAAEYIANPLLLPAGVDDPISHFPFFYEPLVKQPYGAAIHIFCLSPAGSGPVPACAAIGGLPCRPAVHTIPNTTRQHHAKYTPNPAYSTQHITSTEKTVPIQKQTALGTRCNQERRGARRDAIYVRPVR